MKTKKKNYFLIIIILLILCIIAFFVVTIAVDKIERTIYPVKYSDIVEKYASEYNISPFLMYTLIHTESKFEPSARSSANAIGLTQITSETFDWIKNKIARDEELVFESLFEPEIAIRFGSYYISQSLSRYNNDISTAAAAYHSGWGTVDKLLANNQNSQNTKTLEVFPYQQMNLYVKKINKSYLCYLRLYNKGE